MLLAMPNFNIFSFSFLCIITFLVFFAGYSLANENMLASKSKRLFVSTGTIILLILVLAFFKYSFLQNISFSILNNQRLRPATILFIIGISYSTFKMIHFIIESYKKKISQINLLNFVNYIFFFPAFISGPINRYNHFCNQLKLNNDNLKNDLKKGVERIIHGLFKKFVLCTIVFPYTIVNLKEPIASLNGLQILIGCYAYALYFYFDFSGYSDIAIGSAKIMGIELPENFNNPFFKKNIQQLWAGWHISFTSWLTDYIYWPLSKKLRTLLFFKNRPVFLSNFSIIVTFIVCGIWHGDTIYFVLWGLYHGLGLAALNTYKKYKRKVRNKTLRSYYRSKYSEVIGIVATFNFFAVGILFFAF